MACDNDNNQAALAGGSTGEDSTCARICEFAGLAIFAAVGLWLLVASLCAMWLAYQVPITDTDLAQASWLPSYTTATHFSGFMAWAMGFTVLLMGLGIAFAKQSLLPCLASAALLCGVSLNSEQLMVRIGIATDTIKVGCFVYEAKECRVMQGLPAMEAPSRYGDDGLNADWYVTARQKAVTARPTDVALQSIPGWAFLQAPLYVTDAPRIKAKLEQQRADLAALKAAQ